MLEGYPWAKKKKRSRREVEKGHSFIKLPIGETKSWLTRETSSKKSQSQHRRLFFYINFHYLLCFLTTSLYFAFFFFKGFFPPYMLSFQARSRRKNWWAFPLQLTCSQMMGGRTMRNPNRTKSRPENFLRWKCLLTWGSCCHHQDYWRKLFTGSGPTVPQSLLAVLEAACTKIALTQVPIHCQWSTRPSLKCFLVSSHSDLGLDFWGRVSPSI